MKNALPEIAVVGPEALTERRLRASLEAIAEMRECYRVLAKAGLNIVGEVLKGQGPFYQMDHYPKDDVYDREFHSQYYYHAHRDDHDEHGHFHLFVRDAAIPAGLAPLAGPAGDARVAHLVAIAMDAWGFPVELFAVNRWVTDESWFAADAVIALLDAFKVDHASPSWPVNRWLTAMVRCYRPQIEALIRHREAVIAAHADRPLTEVLEDRTLETTGSLLVDTDAWQASLETELARRGSVSRLAES
ncbi:DUF6969 family protein [Marinobacter sp. X15-166B]|uniref:DUF6969 family protein n=1 Tax=Marinobacter sp. X15-166B TaxID=1897620 RepID=UPI00085C0FF6|nr:hypothetical protein [Marinobacter sp. X15-166B]OEY66201.1 hypothetical protein BG841_06845 [Marinobacter sp. X15-166B]